MSKQLFIMGQTPYVTLPITSVEDAENRTFEIKIGFKRYTTEKGLELVDSLKDKSEEELIAIIKDNILFMQDVTLPIYDMADPSNPVYVEDRQIKDTRHEKEFGDFWSDPKSCLSVLVEMYLGSVLWKSPIITTFMDAMFNRPLDKIAKAKN